MFKFEAAPQKIFIISVRALIVNKALGVSVQLPVDPTHSLETLRGAQIAISLSQPHKMGFYYAKEISQPDPHTPSLKFLRSSSPVRGRFKVLRVRSCLQ